MRLWSKALILAIGATFSGVGHAADFSFTFAHVLTEDTPNARRCRGLQGRSRENSDGRIEINIRPAAQLGGDVEIIEQTQMGLVHLAIPPTGNLANFNEQMYLFDLPFLLGDDEAMMRVLDGEVGTELLATLDEQSSRHRHVGRWLPSHDQQHTPDQWS